MRLNLPALHNSSDLEALTRYASQCVDGIVTAINGNLNFQENLQISLVSVNFSAANQSQTIAHNLGRMPAGYIITSRTVNGNVFDGSGGLTTDIANLQASVVGTYGLLFF